MKQDEGALDEYLEGALLWPNRQQNNDWKTFQPYANKLERRFYSYCSISWNYSSTVFSQVKKSWWLERDRRGQRASSTFTRAWAGLMSSHFGTGDRVRVVFDGEYDLSPGAIYELQATGYHFSRDTLTTWTSSKVFLLLIILCRWSEW